MSETAPAPPSRAPALRTVLAILALRDVPFWTKSWPRRVLRLVVLLLYGIMLITLILCRSRTGSPSPARLRHRLGGAVSRTSCVRERELDRARRQHHPRLVHRAGGLAAGAGRGPVLARQRQQPQQLAGRFCSYRNASWAAPC